MTVGRISMLCWIVFVVMCLGFLPVAAGLIAITDSMAPVPRHILVIGVTVGLWWGPFVYAMYLTMAVVRNGDKRLLKRGIHGTALVVSGRETNEVIQSGEFAWEAPRVYKYKLEVTIPGRDPYQTYCSICAAGIAEGSTVDVAVSPHNHKRVTIDVGQGATSPTAGPHSSRPGGGASPEMIRALQQQLIDRTAAPSNNGSPDTERIDDLAKLGQLHSKGVLTDEEFASEKARLLGR